MKRELATEGGSGWTEGYFVETLGPASGLGPRGFVAVGDYFNAEKSAHRNRLRLMTSSTARELASLLIAAANDLDAAQGICCAGTPGHECWTHVDVDGARCRSCIQRLAGSDGDG